VVEGTALEMRHTRKGIVGSNPTLSANRPFHIDCRAATRNDAGGQMATDNIEKQHKIPYASFFCTDLGRNQVPLTATQ
jgi:hypothetical protein